MKNLDYTFPNFWFSQAMITFLICKEIWQLVLQSLLVVLVGGHLLYVACHTNLKSFMPHSYNITTLFTSNYLSHYFIANALSF